ncbi:acyl-CoA dehydrogenase [Micrococcoides hystricis]|uniref:Acyl-CoA dehydrogenase n=1 Tax=Micrococcoides hystricis TaxID=1572761 RepID=A0ABV6PCD0_9MICC
MTATLDTATSATSAQQSQRPSLNELRERFRPVFDAIAHGALERELNRELPYEQVQLLVDSGFTALQAPVAYGGADIAVADLYELLIELAVADSNLPQILHAHFAFTEIHRFSPQPISDWWLRQVGAGKVISNGMVALGGPGEVEQTEDGEVYSGTKTYSTGALFADEIFIVVGTKESGMPLMYVVPAEGAGVNRVDDWDGIGQRLTASGTTVYERVALDPEKVLDIESPAGLLVAPAVLFIHAAAQAGIAEAAVRDAAWFVRQRKRTYGHAAAEYPKDDPQVQEVVGRAASHAYAAKQLVRQGAADLQGYLARAGRLSDTTSPEYQQLFTEAVTDVNSAAAAVSEHALAATNLLFEVGGASVLQRERGFDRHWRNARVLASHNPAHYKLRVVGEYLINGTTPSPDSFVRPVKPEETK